MDWQPFAAAAFAPIVIWILWRGQTLSTHLLRNRLLVLARYRSQRWLYNTVSWFGTFIHEISHASVLLLSGHGIKEFRAGAETGHVLPARMAKGSVGFLFFLVAALAPLFIPAALVLGGLLLLVDTNLLHWLTPTTATLGGVADVLRQTLVQLPLALVSAIGHLDLARPQHAAMLLLILLASPAARPSHVKGSRFHGTKDEGDVAVLRQRIRQRPLPFLLFLIVLYGAALAADLWFPPAYWFPVEAIWAVALTGIVIALVSALWWTLVGLDGRTKWFLGWLGFAAFLAVQVAGRLPPLALMDVLTLNLVSLGAWLLVGLALAFGLPRSPRIPG